MENPSNKFSRFKHLKENFKELKNQDATQESANENDYTSKYIQEEKFEEDLTRLYNARYELSSPELDRVGSGFGVNGAIETEEEESAEEDEDETVDSDEEDEEPSEKEQEKWKGESTILLPSDEEGEVNQGEQDKEKGQPSIMQPKDEKEGEVRDKEPSKEEERPALSQAQEPLDPDIAALIKEQENESDDDSEPVEEEEEFSVTDEELDKAIETDDDDFDENDLQDDGDNDDDEIDINLSDYEEEDGFSFEGVRSDGKEDITITPTTRMSNYTTQNAYSSDDDDNDDGRKKKKRQMHRSRSHLSGRAGSRSYSRGSWTDDKSQSRARVIQEEDVIQEEEVIPEFAEPEIIFSRSVSVIEEFEGDIFEPSTDNENVPKLKFSTVEFDSDSTDDACDFPWFYLTGELYVPREISSIMSDLVQIVNNSLKQEDVETGVAETVSDLITRVEESERFARTQIPDDVKTTMYYLVTETVNIVDDPSPMLSKDLSKFSVISRVDKTADKISSSSSDETDNMFNIEATFSANYNYDSPSETESNASSLPDSYVLENQPDIIKVHRPYRVQNTYQKCRKKEKRYFTSSYRTKIFDRVHPKHKRHKGDKTEIPPDKEIPSYKCMMSTVEDVVDKILTLTLTEIDNIEFAREEKEKQQSVEESIFTLLDCVDKEVKVRRERKITENYVKNVIIEELLLITDYQVDVRKKKREENDFERFAIHLVQASMTFAVRDVIGDESFYSTLREACRILKFKAETKKESKQEKKKAVKKKRHEFASHAQNYSNDHERNVMASESNRRAKPLNFSNDKHHTSISKDEMGKKPKVVHDNDYKSISSTDLTKENLSIRDKKFSVGLNEQEHALKENIRRYELNSVGSVSLETRGSGDYLFKEYPAIRLQCSKDEPQPNRKEILQSLPKVNKEEYCKQWLLDSSTYIPSPPPGPKPERRNNFAGRTRRFTKIRPDTALSEVSDAVPRADVKRVNAISKDDIRGDDRSNPESVYTGRDSAISLRTSSSVSVSTLPRPFLDEDVVDKELKEIDVGGGLYSDCFFQGTYETPRRSSKQDSLQEQIMMIRDRYNSISESRGNSRRNSFFDENGDNQFAEKRNSLSHYSAPVECTDAKSRSNCRVDSGLGLTETVPSADKNKQDLLLHSNHITSSDIRNTHETNGDGKIGLDGKRIGHEADDADIEPVKDNDLEDIDLKQFGVNVTNNDNDSSCSENSIWPPESPYIDNPNSPEVPESEPEDLIGSNPQNRLVIDRNKTIGERILKKWAWKSHRNGLYKWIDIKPSKFCTFCCSKN